MSPAHGSEKTEVEPAEVAGRTDNRLSTPTAERLGLNPSDCGFDSRLGHLAKHGSMDISVHPSLRCNGGTRLCEGRRPGSTPGKDIFGMTGDHKRSSSVPGKLPVSCELRFS